MLGISYFYVFTDQFSLIRWELVRVALVGGSARGYGRKLRTN